MERSIGTREPVDLSIFDPRKEVSARSLAAHLSGMANPSVRVGTRRVAYQLFGDLLALKEPIVFLHGWGMTPDVYERPLKELARSEKRLVIALALPGFGGSDTLPLGSGQIEHITTHLIDAIDQIRDRGLMRGERFDLVGHSFGGAISLAIAAKVPNWIRSLTCICPAGGAADGALPWHRMALGILADTGHRWSPRATTAVVKNLLAHAATLASTAHTARTCDLADRLPVVAWHGVSTLFVFATHDSVIAPGPAFRTDLPNIRVEVVEGRHGWILSHPHRFAAMFAKHARERTGEMTAA
jgi:pimeloyl-ACP methyl ester carboxylesterase